MSISVSDMHRLRYSVLVNAYSNCSGNMYYVSWPYGKTALMLDKLINYEYESASFRGLLHDPVWTCYYNIRALVVLGMCKQTNGWGGTTKQTKYSSLKEYLWFHSYCIKSLAVWKIAIQWQLDRGSHNIKHIHFQAGLFAHNEVLCLPSNIKWHLKQRL